MCFVGRNLAKPVILSFHTAVAKNGLCVPYLLYSESLFPLCLSESQGMFNLGQIYQNSEAKIFKPAHCCKPMLCSLIILKDTVSANRSMCYMKTLL